MLVPAALPWAYIDPVSGSILLQVILAGLVGTLGYFFRPILRIVRRVFGTPPQDPSPPPQDQTPNVP